MIPLLLALTVLSLEAQQEIPYRQENTYEIKLDYDFKNRVVDDQDVVRVSERFRKERHGLLPYLIVNFSLLKIEPDDYRIRVTDNAEDLVLSKKIKPDQVYKIDMGFTDDMKDGVTPNRFNIHFIDQQKTLKSRVVLEVLEDGTFLVNERVHGRL